MPHNRDDLSVVDKRPRRPSAALSSLPSMKRSPDNTAARGGWLHDEKSSTRPISSAAQSDRCREVDRTARRDSCHRKATLQHIHFIAQSSHPHRMLMLERNPCILTSNAAAYTLNKRKSEARSTRSFRFCSNIRRRFSRSQSRGSNRRFREAHCRGNCLCHRKRANQTPCQPQRRHRNQSES